MVSFSVAARNLLCHEDTRISQVVGRTPLKIAKINLTGEGRCHPLAARLIDFHTTYGEGSLVDTPKH